MNVIIPSSPEDRSKIQNALKEISNAFTRIESEKDYINDTLEVLQDQFELPKKYMRKIAAIYHKQNINEVTSEATDIQDLYNTIVS